MGNNKRVHTAKHSHEGKAPAALENLPAGPILSKTPSRSSNAFPEPVRRGLELWGYKSEVLGAGPNCTGLKLRVRQSCQVRASQTKILDYVVESDGTAKNGAMYGVSTICTPNRVDCIRWEPLRKNIRRSACNVGGTIRRWGSAEGPFRKSAVTARRKRFL